MARRYVETLPGGRFRLIERNGGVPVLDRVVTELPDAWADLAAVAARRPSPILPGLPDDRPLVMGVINVTPDSFSDGGDRLRPEDAVAAGEAMLAAGADILDIGGESTRPGASRIPPAEEIARIVPVVAALGRLAPVSVDTRNAATMQAALAAGARIVNDVSGLVHDPAATSVVADAGCPVVLMHMRGTPATMHAHAGYDDVVLDVYDELAERVARAEAAGIARGRIIVDPGIGFAKTGAQNLDLLRRLGVFRGFGLPVLVGASRKRFIGHYGGAAEPKRRMPGSLAAALWAAINGASILRVHDVAETVQALLVWRAIAGR
ncbi:dihydropteroate synthase [Elioraea sp.]|uniref:dihydropteroate synthase n=1 Tax=Elioraea sp. TaxID=2185103 RepID=UPI003F72ADF3